MPAFQPRPLPKAKPHEQEVIVKVNLYIRDLYEAMGDERRKKAQRLHQENRDKKLGKSAPQQGFAEGSFFQGLDQKTSIECYLAYNGCTVEVAFDGRIRPAVEAKHPSFYKYYKSPNDADAAMSKFDMAWKWG